MKKILTILACLLLLVGCSSTSSAKPDFDSGFTIETYKADMSGYENLKSTGHMFLGTTVLELKRTIDEKGYGAFVLSRTSCSHCQIAMQYLNQAAEELGVYVYYIDAESDAYPILGTDNYDTLYNALYDVLAEDDEGNKELQTPHFFTIIDGEIVGSQIGTTWNGNSYSESDANKLVETYKKLLTPFINESQD